MLRKSSTGTVVDKERITYCEEETIIVQTRTEKRSIESSKFRPITDASFGWTCFLKNIRYVASNGETFVQQEMLPIQKIFKCQF